VESHFLFIIKIGIAVLEESQSNLQEAKKTGIPEGNPKPWKSGKPEFAA
jgi:hypothetical protein